LFNISINSSTGSDFYPVKSDEFLNRDTVVTPLTHNLDTRNITEKYEILINTVIPDPYRGLLYPKYYRCGVAIFLPGEQVFTSKHTESYLSEISMGLFASNMMDLEKKSHLTLEDIQKASPPWYSNEDWIRDRSLSYKMKTLAAN